jgi:hypothetical protein
MPLSMSIARLVDRYFEFRISLRSSCSLVKAESIFRLSESSIFHDLGPEREPQYDAGRRQLIERS